MRQLLGMLLLLAGGAVFVVATVLAVVLREVSGDVRIAGMAAGGGLVLLACGGILFLI